MKERNEKEEKPKCLLNAQSQEDLRQTFPPASFYGGDLIASRLKAKQSPVMTLLERAQFSNHKFDRNDFNISLRKKPGAPLEITYLIDEPLGEGPLAPLVISAISMQRAKPNSASSQSASMLPHQNQEAADAKEKDIKIDNKEEKNDETKKSGSKRKNKECLTKFRT